MEKVNLKQLTDDLGFACLAGESLNEVYPESAYVSDLLSDVMGKAQAGMLWVTSQIHKNIIAVASLKELSAIVVVNERTPAPELIEHAKAEGVIVLASNLPAFETAGKLYNYLDK
ncbi:MAG: serine kinase [Petrimonas sp.]|nr:serine kinase [Petrimonas sp.]